MKYCPKCEKELDIEEFGLNKSRHDGRQDLCKLHAAERSREYYANNKEKHKTTVRIYKLKNPYQKLTHKICKKCKQDKPIDKYGGVNNQDQKCWDCKNPPKTIKSDTKICLCCNKEHKTKKENVCSSCISVYNRYRKKHYLVSLIGGKCSNCGLDDLLCLDFHHIDPKNKSFTIGSNLPSKSIEILEEEAKKCVLLCSHCHRKHHGRMDIYILDYFERNINNTKKRKEEKEYTPNESKRKVKRPSKEELHKLVWSMPTIEIAKLYGVSDKSIEKWCRCYEIDKPPRGYWAKKRSKVMSNYITYNTNKEAS